MQKNGLSTIGIKLHETRDGINMFCATNYFTMLN